MDYSRNQGMIHSSNSPVVDATISPSGLKVSSAEAPPVASSVRNRVLLYSSNTGLLDIIFAVEKLALYCSDLQVSHQLADKRLLQYLKGAR